MKLIQYYRKMQVMQTIRKTARKYIVIRKLDRQLKNRFLDIDEDKMIKSSIASADLVEKELNIFEKRISEFLKEIGKNKGE